MEHHAFNAKVQEQGVAFLLRLLHHCPSLKVFLPLSYCCSVCHILFYDPSLSIVFSLSHIVCHIVLRRGAVCCNVLQYALLLRVLHNCPSLKVSLASSLSLSPSLSPLSLLSLAVLLFVVSRSLYLSLSLFVSLAFGLSISFSALFLFSPTPS